MLKTLLILVVGILIFVYGFGYFSEVSLHKTPLAEYNRVFLAQCQHYVAVQVEGLKAFWEKHGFR